VWRRQEHGRTGWLVWNFHKQEWDAGDVFDTAHFGDCDEETKIKMVEVVTR
jgi:hypothetical protein